jgi:hypothetical protein
LATVASAQHAKGVGGSVHPEATLAPEPPVGAKTVWAITGGDLTERLRILASDSLQGRRTGEPGAARAASYIAKEFTRINLSPLDSAGTFYQNFEFSERALDTSRHAKTKGANIVGILRSDDPVLSKEYVVVGAHYDHLGWGDRHFALDSVHAIHYGADDNASGVAGLLELAEHLSRERYQLKRSVIFIAFSGEEEGLFGSDFFTSHPLVPLQNVQAMINMDMIGRMSDSALIIQGIGSSPAWKDLIRPLPSAQGLTLKLTATGRGPSDHSKFYSQNIPVLFFFTGYHKDYHRATDTWDKINYTGEAKVVKLVEEVVSSIANQSDRLAFTRVPGDTERTATAFRVYVGGVPDYGYDGEGVRISETTEGSPAERAGLKKGDVLVEFDGMKIHNIYDYTDALGKHKPDDLVRIVVQRKGAGVTLPLTLGRRPASHD